MGQVCYTRNTAVSAQTARLELLADFYESQGKYAEAEMICRRIIEIKESVFGRDSSELANDLHNLGLLCYAQDKYEQSEQFLTRCLYIEEDCFGKSHVRLASTLDVLAQLFYEQGKYAQAVDCCTRAIEICGGSLSAFAGVHLSCIEAAEFVQMEQDEEDSFSLLPYPCDDQLICMAPVGEA